METDDAAAAASPGVIITYVPSKSVYPQTVTKDYGSGVSNGFGHVKKGKLIITYSAPVKTPGSTSVTVFKNYYIDNKKIVGEQLVTNTTKTGGPLSYTNLLDRSTIYPNGDYTKTVAKKTTVQTEGGATATTSDDGYNINGQTFGTEFHNGFKTSVVATIDSKNPTHQMNSCEFPDAGVVNAVVTLVKGGTFRESLDYGAGTCDTDAVLTFNNKKHNITLPLQFWPVE